MNGWRSLKGEWDSGSSVADPDGRSPTIFFQRVPEEKTVKNPLHLDLDASAGSAVPLAERKRQVDTEVERRLGLGATRPRLHLEGDHYHVVMQDPEGNEFCVR